MGKAKRLKDGGIPQVFMNLLKSLVEQIKEDTRKLFCWDWVWRDWVCHKTPYSLGLCCRLL